MEYLKLFAVESELDVGSNEELPLTEEIISDLLLDYIMVPIVLKLLKPILEAKEIVFNCALFREEYVIFSYEESENKSTHLVINDNWLDSFVLLTISQIVVNSDRCEEVNADFPMDNITSGLNDPLAKTIELYFSGDPFNQ